jgi:hypothetical protein
MSWVAVGVAVVVATDALALTAYQHSEQLRTRMMQAITCAFVAAVEKGFAVAVARLVDCADHTVVVA